MPATQAAELGVINKFRGAEIDKGKSSFS